MKNRLEGKIFYQNNTQDTFTTYRLTSDVKAVAGTYTSFITATETATVVLTSTEGISGSSNTGCIFTGSFSPRAHGNVFDVTITFGEQDGCTIGPETVNGVGFFMQESFTAPR